MRVFETSSISCKVDEASSLSCKADKASSLALSYYFGLLSSVLLSAIYACFSRNICGTMDSLERNRLEDSQCRFHDVFCVLLVPFSNFIVFSSSIFRVVRVIVIANMSLQLPLDHAVLLVLRCLRLRAKLSQRPKADKLRGLCDKFAPKYLCRSAPRTKELALVDLDAYES